MRVLFVEDDIASAKSIESMLKAGGILCNSMNIGAASLKVETLYGYDLIILDLLSADTEGHQLICRLIQRLRGTRQQTPILILSDLDEPDSIIRGLDLGAVDYVTRPFDQSELIARIQAVVRPGHGHSGSLIRTGNIAVNLDSRTVQVNGVPVHITGREFGILELLSAHKGTTVTKDTILTYLYAGMVEPDQKIIDVFVCTLRRKLSEAGLVENGGAIIPH
mgnify:CR=1 FL=1